MIHANVKEARQQFSYLLNQVENGEEVLILRRGNIVAHIIPHSSKKNHKKLPSLKHFRSQAKVKGTPLSTLITKAREEK